MIKIAACATHPIQYQSPIWRRLTAMPGIEFEAFFGSDLSVRGYTDREFGTKVKWDTPLTQGYTHTFLSIDQSIESVGAWNPGATGLSQQFRRFRPDVVLLTAYAGRFHLGALRAARAVGAKVIMRHEASDLAVKRTRLKGAVRDWFLRRLYSRIDGFSVIGSAARQHLLRLGVPAEKMQSSPYCVDSDFFAGEVDRWGAQRETIRSELGIRPDDIAVMFSGKLIPKKDPLLIPAAIALVNSEMRAHIHLLVAGDGELSSALERAGREVLGQRCHLLGFLNQTQIGRVYSAGDVLVLPSRLGAGETWGLVVNEAMQFGLPVLASDGVGCSPDLLSQGTGAVFSSADSASLAAAMTRFISAMPEERSHFRRKTQILVEGFSVAAAAEGIARSARHALGIRS